MSNKVIAISSYVCSGNVGNRSGMIILDTFQIQTCFILTTHLSNHTQYAHLGGSGIETSQLASIMDAVKANHLDKDVKYIVGGYFPSADFVDETIRRVKELKERNDVYFFCDPILGDNGKMYTNPEVLKSMKELVKYADIITPNATELSFLTDMPINTIPDAQVACAKLHEQGIPIILVTSIDEGDDILLYCSYKEQTETNKNFSIRVRRMNGRFTGVGDVLTYVVLAWVINGLPIVNAVNRAITTLQTILKNTEGNDEINLIASIPYLKEEKELFDVTYH